MKFRNSMLVAATMAALISVSAVNAKTFKWASQGEIQSWDIHASNNGLQNGIHAWVYESLVYFNSRSFKVEPMLASSWKEISATEYQFNLRKGVKFHDGTPMTAEDVVFSLTRALAKTSNFTVYTQGIGKVVAVDTHTVKIVLNKPNPVLLNQLTELRIMSKAWAEKNNSTLPKDIKSPEENFAHRNANGTGPFLLKQWTPDQRMVFARNDSWWGQMEGNVTEIVYTPIKSDATRVAALLSGELDMVLDPSPQDLTRLRGNDKLRVIEGPENRTIFLGMDQFRDELPGSSVKGKNPLKDRRVRQALYQAIDANAISKNILRGLGQPTGTMVSPQVNGWTTSLDQRMPFDIEASKKLLAEAGYGSGFEVDFACPNNRYINDEEICQAITAMWAKIGVNAKLRTMPLATYFPMIQKYEASIYMLGWGVPTFDGLYSAQSLFKTVGAGGDGNYNVGRMSHPRVDTVIERVKEETFLPQRTRFLVESLQIVKDEVNYIPLHNQIVPWATKSNVQLVHRADNRIDIRLVKIN